MICSAVQFFLYFPVDKILFHKRKEEAVEEAPAAEEAAAAVEETADVAEEIAAEADDAE
jgi:hypothetical protein